MGWSGLKATCYSNAVERSVAGTILKECMCLNSSKKDLSQCTSRTLTRWATIWWGRLKKPTFRCFFLLQISEVSCVSTSTNVQNSNRSANKCTVISSFLVREACNISFLIRAVLYTSAKLTDAWASGYESTACCGKTPRRAIRQCRGCVKHSGRQMSEIS